MYNQFVKTLIEIYDNDMILNLIGMYHLQPEKVIFLYTAEQKNLIENSLIERYADCEKIYRQYRLDTLESLLDEYDEDSLYVDVHGGNDLTIAAVSALAREKGFRLCYAGTTTNQFYLLEGDEITTEELRMPKLTVREIIELYGGKVRDLPEAHYDEHGRKAVEECLSLRRSATKKWNNFCKAMGSAGTAYKDMRIWRCDSRFAEEYKAILDSLNHVFDSCEIQGSKLVLEFHDPAYQILVTDTGVPFEYETYYQMTDSGAFDDVDLRVKIDWNGGEFVSGDPNSELDVVASLNSRLISVSCKSGKYDQQAIYEVKANADKFGGQSSVPVLCADIDMDRPEYVEKARELNVLLIEHKDMKEKRAAQMILDWLETH